MLKTTSALCLSLLTLVSASAVEHWTDREGTSFNGTPVEALGPLALFQTSSVSGVKPAFRHLTEADCVRFFEKIKTKAPRADEWTHATGYLTHLLIDKMKQLDGERLVDANLKGLPEPAFVIVFFSDKTEGPPWDMLVRAVEPFKKVQADHPGLIAGLYFGIQHGGPEHSSTTARLHATWMIADYFEQFRHMNEIRDLAPTTPDEYSIMVLSRDGVPLFAAQDPKDSEVDKLFADISGLAALMKPENPHAWPDEVYYQRAVQASLHAADRSNPMLIGNPLLPGGLRQRKIFDVAAAVDVDAEGKVTAFTLKPESDVPASMAGALGDAFKKTAAFVPAVDHGKFVAGKYDYHLQIPH